MGIFPHFLNEPLYRSARSPDPVQRRMLMLMILLGIFVLLS